MEKVTEVKSITGRLEERRLYWSQATGCFERVKNKYSEGYTGHTDQYICLLTVHKAAQGSIHKQEAMYIPPSFSRSVILLFIFTLLI